MLLINSVFHLVQQNQKAGDAYRLTEAMLLSILTKKAKRGAISNSG
jgi:hypothetical protein